MSNHIKWNVSYSTIVWFESRLNAHKNVKSFQRRNDIVFDIRRIRQDDSVTAVIVSEYVFGEASLHKVLSDFRDINLIVLIGNWNKFTQDASQASYQTGIPLFRFGEFYSALSRDEM